MTEKAEKIDEEIKEEFEKEYTEIEQKAMEDGWIPPDRFDKEEQGKDFISAEKYLENSSFFKKINAQKHEIDNLKKTVSEINEHNRRVAQREQEELKQQYEARIEVLKQEKIEALDEGDNRRVVEIDEQIRTTPKPQPVNPVNHTFNNWVKDNKWYQTDPELKQYADMIGDGYMAQHPDSALESLYAFVEKETKVRFPDKFENKQRTAAPSVEGGGTPKPQSRTATEKDLTADERTIFNDMVRFNAFKDDAAKKSYIKEVIKLRD